MKAPHSPGPVLAYPDEEVFGLKTARASSKLLERNSMPPKKKENPLTLSELIQFYQQVIKPEMAEQMAVQMAEKLREYHQNTAKPEMLSIRPCKFAKRPNLFHPDTFPSNS